MVKKNAQILVKLLAAQGGKSMIGTVYLRTSACIRPLLTDLELTQTTVLSALGLFRSMRMEVDITNLGR